MGDENPGGEAAIIRINQGRRGVTPKKREPGIRPLPEPWKISNPRLTIGSGHKFKQDPHRIWIDSLCNSFFNFDTARY